MEQPAASVLLALAGIRGFSERERALMLSSLTRRPPLSGRPWDEFSTRMETMADREFTWPEFDRWQAFFAARDSFPVRWDGLREVPPASTAAAGIYQRRKLDLLIEWLEAIARRSAVAAHYARQGLGTRIAHQDVRDACDVCARFIARPADAGPGVLPPFHPGCRSVLLAEHAPGERARVRKA